MNYQTIGASIIGRDHVGIGNVLVGKNNQDSFCVTQDDDRAVAIVCDGCGGQPHSEVGSQLGARFLSRAIYKTLYNCGSLRKINSYPLILSYALVDLLKEILRLSKLLDDNKVKAIDEYFLFTIVGAIVDHDGCVVFSIGDGFYALNDNVCHSLGPFKDNEPPYAAYGLTGTKSKPPDHEAWKFQILAKCSADEFKHVLIGTDGVRSLLSAKDKKITGKDEVVGGIEQFWLNDAYFNGPNELHNRLALIGRNFTAVKNGQLKREHGLLIDDTTLAVIRRQPDIGA